MSKVLLHIDSSPRKAQSTTRQLTREFVLTWKRIDPESQVIYRDLGHEPVPFIDEAWIAASFTPPDQHTPEMQQAIALSDQLVDELWTADYYLFGIPMYNLSIPANFKAYIDQIVRANRTLTAEDTGNGLLYKGLLNHKKMLVITARSDNYRPGTEFAHEDFQEPYLQAIFSTIGVSEMRFIHTDNLAVKATRPETLAHARGLIQKVIQEWLY